MVMRVVLTHETVTLQRSASGGPSKYRGVIWHKSNSKWEARIYDSGKQRFLGYYTSEEEAARVYDDAAAKMTGRPVNFPNDHKSSPLEESLSRANSASDEPLDQGKALQLHRVTRASCTCIVSEGIHDSMLQQISHGFPDAHSPSTPACLHNHLVSFTEP